MSRDVDTAEALMIAFENAVRLRIASYQVGQVLRADAITERRFAKIATDDYSAAWTALRDALMEES